MYMKDFTDNTSRNNNADENQNYHLTAHEITFEEAMNALNDAYNGDANAQYIYGKYWSDEYERSKDKSNLSISLKWLKKSSEQGNQNALKVYQLYKRLL